MLIHLLVDHAGRDLTGHILCRSGDDFVFELVYRGFFAVLLQAGLDVLLEVCERVKLGHILGKLVVQLGNDGFLDLVDLALEGRVLARQLRGVSLGEGHFNVAVLAGLDADKRVFKSGDELAGAKLQVVLLALAALERLAVDKAFKVQHNGVAELRGALNGLDAGGSLRHTLQLCLHIGFQDLHFGLGGLNALVGAELNFGIQRGLDRQGQRAVFRNFHIRDRGSADRLELLLGHSGVVDLREQDVDRFFIENALAVHALDDLARRVTLAEAGHHDLLFLLQVRTVDGRLKLLLVDHHNDLCVAVFLFNALNVHYVSSCSRSARSPPIINP